jgi:HK97 family phage prohead protease
VPEFLLIAAVIAVTITALILSTTKPSTARHRAPWGPRFDAGPAIRLDAPGAQAFQVDATSRTISGLLVPWDTVAKSGGYSWSFPEGSVTFTDASRVKLWVQHDPNRAVGFATTLEPRTEPIPGLYGTFKVARGAAGDEALTMAEDRVWDGLSIGIADGGAFDEIDGVMVARQAPLMETSLTPAPAYSDARVHSVAASAARSHTGDTMPEGNTPVETETPTGPDLSAIGEAIREGFANLSAPQGPAIVDATASLEITEPAPYRFDGVRGAHDFSTDLIAFGRDHDPEAGNRVMTFMAEAFAPRFDVSTGDVSSANPVRQRPDLFVDQRQYATPIYDALYSGTLTDWTPFVVPKFNSASGLVADHVEGTEPTPGAYTATSQTVTPTAVSGKVEITREVWDQGGSPQVSGLIWGRMVYEYMRQLEVAAAAVLNGAAASITDLALTTGATDDALVSELEGKLADLQFVAGGDLLTMAMTQQDLYKALVNAVDSAGRKLLPVYGPQNADGTARARFKSLDVAGYEFAPAWSLGATSTASSNSYLIDPSSVHLWNSAPQRLEFQYRVAYVDLGIWGYKAAAVTDTAGVRQITYDPVV